MSKYVKLMADYCSTGLWSKSGINLSENDFPLSEETLTALYDWVDLYETNDDYMEEKNRKQPLFDLKTFSEKGLDLAKKIKADLPYHTVVYFDEYASTLSNDRKYFEYEIS
jgi:hypothetical protein